MTRSRGHFFTLPMQAQEPDEEPVRGDCDHCGAWDVEGTYTDGDCESDPAFLCDECLKDHQDDVDPWKWTDKEPF